MLLAVALSGCAALGGAGPAGNGLDVVAVPAEWQAPLPHGGQLGELARWWQQFDDPLLDRLIAAAEASSPNVAAAATRIEQARATRAAAGAALLPSLGASASASRGRPDFIQPLGNQGSVGLQTTWEIDVFGRNRAAARAADERIAGATAGWHDARVAVAAEVGNGYAALRACEAQLVQTRLDTASRAETSRLTELAMKAGFQPPAAAALARASAAQGNATATQQQAQCDRDVKALVALTGWQEPALRDALRAATAQLPRPAELEVPSVPAEALAQRPDLAVAAREVLAASSDVAQAEADRYPRISLAGNIGAARFETSEGSLSGTLWSIGPVSVSLPIFDAGARRANVAAARARYDEALIAYAAKLRNAVREVEEALIGLESTSARSGDAQVAAENFVASFRATESRYQGGLASLFELEDARRSAVLAQSTLIDLQRERVAAWIALYRALGGGWRSSDGDVSS